MPEETTVVHNVDKERYDLRVDDHLAGFAVYIDRGGRRIFLHTEVLPEHKGKGLGVALAEGTLAEVRREGVPILPLCPFLDSYVAEHPEHADLVDRAMLDALDTPGDPNPAG